MRAMCFSLIVILGSCGGSLPDEQRRQMREKMDEHRIVRVTEAEIMEAAFNEGRETVHLLDSLRGDSMSVQRFIRSYNGEIRFIKPGQNNIHLLEQQLIEAYLADPSGSFQDNVQKVRDAKGNFDTLLYTKPLTRSLPGDGDELIGVWNIWLPKKELIKGIIQKR